MCDSSSSSMNLPCCSFWHIYEMISTWSEREKENNTDDVWILYKFWAPSSPRRATVFRDSPHSATVCFVSACWAESKQSREEQGSDGRNRDSPFCHAESTNTARLIPSSYFTLCSVASCMRYEAGGVFQRGGEKEGRGAKKQASWITLQTAFSQLWRWQRWADDWLVYHYKFDQTWILNCYWIKF